MLSLWLLDAGPCGPPPGPSWGWPPPWHVYHSIRVFTGPDALVEALAPGFVRHVSDGDGPPSPRNWTWVVMDSALDPVATLGFGDC